MVKLALIFVGAGLGGVLRYSLGGWVQGASKTTFPVGTLVVNVTGCLAIGVLSVLLAGRLQVHPDVRDAVLIGLLGGYTTFATFGRETMHLMDSRMYGQAMLYVVVSVAAGFAATWIGLRGAERVWGAATL